jgi:hypothetical protein
MPWTTPNVFDPFDVLTADNLNDIQDNLTYVYGLGRRRVLIVQCLPFNETLTTGDGKQYWTVPAEFNNYVIVDADSAVYTVSSSGTPTFQIHNLTDTVDVLSTLQTIDANEFSSYTAATPPVINTANDDLATGDRIRFDCDVAGTGTKGWEQHVVIQV